MTKHPTKFGAGVPVNNPENSMGVIVCEGPETALSIREVMPNYTIIACLSSGNFSNVNIPKNTSEILFCLDNDGKNASSLSKARDAFIKLKSDKKNIQFTMPTKERNDFNDTLKNEGKDKTLHNIINNKVSFNDKNISQEEFNSIIFKHINSSICKEKLSIKPHLEIKDNEIYL